MVVRYITIVIPNPSILPGRLREESPEVFKKLHANPPGIPQSLIRYANFGSFGMTE